MNLSRAKVRSLAVATQVVALVLLVALVAGAGAAVMLGMPEAGGDAAPLPEPPDPEAFRIQQASTGAGAFQDDGPFDPEGVATVLSEMPGAPKPAASEPDVDGGGEEEPVRAAASRGEVSYVGAILAPSKRLAVLSYDGRQWWVAEGDERTIGGDGNDLRVRVDEVQREFVQASLDGRSRRLSRAERSGARATVMTSRPLEVDPPGQVQDPGDNARRLEQMREMRMRQRQLEGGEMEGMDAESFRSRRGEADRQLERGPNGEVIYRPGDAAPGVRATPGTSSVPGTTDVTGGTDDR